MAKTDSKLWLLIEVKKRMLDRGLTMAKLAKNICVSRATVDRWLRYPESAKVGDLRDVFQVLGYEKEEAAQIIGEIAWKSWRKI